MKMLMLALPIPWAEEPAMNPPLGLCYLASSLKLVTNQIFGLDFALHSEFDYFSEEKQYLRIIPRDMDWYCISCMTPQFYWLKEVVKYIKVQNPASKIIVGGPHASSTTDCEKIPEIDYIVKGEGDFAVVNIILKDIYHKNYQIIKDLDNLPFPDRDIFGGLNKYKRSIDNQRAVHIVTLRGCPYSCAFCSKDSVTTHVRFRSLEDTIAEIDYIIKKYDTKSFVIYDDIFTLSRDRVTNFCKEFKKRKIKWRCWSRTNLLTEEILAEMKNSGLISITLGVESGSNKILQNINKQTTVEQNRNALLLCKKLKVPVRCSLMYGNPGEDKDTVNETIRLLEETQPDEWNLSVLNPIPGSDIWKNPKNYGIIFNKKLIKNSNYLTTNRFGKSGIGDVSIKLKGQTQKEFNNNLFYFIEALEKVCPRNKIQDTIQTIKIKNT